MEDNNPEFVHVQTLTKGQAFVSYIRYCYMTGENPVS